MILPLFHSTRHGPPLSFSLGCNIYEVLSSNTEKNKITAKQDNKETLTLGNTNENFDLY